RGRRWRRALQHPWSSPGRGWSAGWGRSAGWRRSAGWGRSARRRCSPIRRGAQPHRAPEPRRGPVDPAGEPRLESAQEHLLLSLGDAPGRDRTPEPRLELSDHGLLEAGGCLAFLLGDLRQRLAAAQLAHQLHVGQPEVARRGGQRAGPRESRVAWNEAWAWAWAWAEEQRELSVAEPALDRVGLGLG